MVSANGSDKKKEQHHPIVPLLTEVIVFVYPICPKNHPTVPR